MLCIIELFLYNNTLCFYETNVYKNTTTIKMFTTFVKWSVNCIGLIIIQISSQQLHRELCQISFIINNNVLLQALQRNAR